jgi:hypothetical protein
MKMSEAKEIIDGKHLRLGYCVHFEVRERGMLRSDYFPDVRAGELGLETEEEAWRMAADFARAPQKHEVVNVFVVRARDFAPVDGYAERTLNRYPF